MSFHRRDLAAGVAPATPLADLRPLERRFIAALRLWLGDPEARTAVWNDLARTMGAADGRAALAAFEDYLAAVAEGAARRLKRGAPGDPLACADECALAAALTGAVAPGFIRPDARGGVIAAARRAGMALAAGETDPAGDADLAEFGLRGWRRLTAGG